MKTRLLSTGLLLISIMSASATRAQEEPQPPCCAPAPGASQPGYPPPPPAYPPYPNYPRPYPPPNVYVPPPIYPPPYVPSVTYHEELRPRYGLMIGGLITFGASYFPAAVIGWVADQNTLAIPIAGPIVFSALHLNNHDPFERFATAFLVTDSLLQVAGVTMALVGGVTKHRVRVRDKFVIAPKVTGQQFGFAAAGRF
jgi:hypothetical protein